MGLVPLAFEDGSSVLNLFSIDKSIYLFTCCDLQSWTAVGEFSGYWYSGSGSLWHWWLSSISSSVPLTCSVQPSGYSVEKLQVCVDWDNQLTPYHAYGSKLFAKAIKVWDKKCC